MLKKEVKRMEWGIAQVQPDQRAEAKYLLGIVEDGGDAKSVKPVEPKEEPKNEEEKKIEEEDEEEVVNDEEEIEDEIEDEIEEEIEDEEEEEVEETKKK